MYRDTTNGKIVSKIKTGLGLCRAMKQNPTNAILNLGHHNGVVTLWSPSVKEPLVKMLTHRGPINDLAISPNGNYMVTGASDGMVKVWDLRTYKLMETYFLRKAVDTLDISQTGLLAMGFGSHVQLWKNYAYSKAEAPYMLHNIKGGNSIGSLKFCPYEDVLGVGHANGFSSILVPGSGEPNIDSYEANPYESKNQRRERTVRRALEKIPADMITIDPDFVGRVTDMDTEEYRTIVRGRQ